MLRPTSTLIQAAGFTAAALCLEGSQTPIYLKIGKFETPQAITATILHLEELDEAESHHRVDCVEQLIADDYQSITMKAALCALP
jgi:hypothetical protein